MKKFFKIVLIVILAFILVSGGGMFYLSRGLDAGKNLVINGIKPSTLSDGIYIGKYNSGRWTNELKVTIKDNKITQIDVMKDVMVPKPEWTKELFNRVIEKQSINVDTVSGATVTSKAYLKSIESALAK